MSAAYKYGRHSRAVLATLHPKLRELVQAVLEYRDHKLLRGVRDVAEQAGYVEAGLSQTMDSRHLPGGGYRDPSDVLKAEAEFPDLAYAVDMTVFHHGKVSYVKREVAYFMGYVQAKADELGIEIRWGGDWDSDVDQDEHAFWDGVHVELKRGVYA